LNSALEPACFRRHTAFIGLGLLFVVIGLWNGSLYAVTLWSDVGTTLARETGPGRDVLEGAVKRDDTSNDTLYFKFHLNPLSDSTTEEYFAGFELFEGDTERLGIGNALKAWAYTAFVNQNVAGENKSPSYIDLHSAKPETPPAGMSLNYELPRRGVERTIVFKVQYVAGGEDLVTVWLNPDLGAGANEILQAESLTTRFNANASFDELRLRHGGAGEGWLFSDLAIATTFSDFVDTSSAKPRGPALGGGPNEPLPHFQSWQRQEGMPPGPIRALAQTCDGYVWLGGDDGLARFDGARFVAMDLQNQGQIEAIHCLCGDERGALWIGSAGGLTRLQEGVWTRFTAQKGLPGKAVLALAGDKQGRTWAGTEAGLAILQKDQICRVPGIEMFRGKAITALFKDRQGAMWVGVRGGGVFKYDHEKFNRLEEGSVKALLEDPHCILVDRTDRVWVGAGDDFVLCREGEQWNRYRLPRHSPRPYVSGLAEEADGTVWAGSVSEGLFRFNQGKLYAVNASSGLLDNLVTAILLDREGKLWAGTETGLNRLRYRNLFPFGQDEGLGQGTVRGLGEVAPGVVWALKPNGGVYRWEGKTFARLNAAGLAPRDPAVGALLVGRDGSCWMGSSNGLLYFKDPQAVADESRLFPLPNLTIISLAEDGRGKIWAGTKEGELWSLNCGSWSQFKSFPRLTGITALAAGADGSLWIGTEGSGLYRSRDEAGAHSEKCNGLLSDSIRTLCLSGDVLWIGTGGGGLSRWRENRVYNFTTREGLPENNIAQILEDDSNRLWLGGNRGIACVDKKELEGVAARKTSAIHPRIYDRTEGMVGEECSSGFFPAGLKARSGLLWFSTTKGIVMADPRRQAGTRVAPSVMLEEVLVDGIPHPDLRMGRQSEQANGSNFEGLRLAPGKHRFEIQYTSLNFDTADQMRFAYRLEGLDTDWVDAGARRTAFYNYVPPGEYHFHVIALNNSGSWSEAGAKLALTVSPYFWQEWWVMAMTGLALLVIVGSAVRLIEKRKLRRQLQKVEQERVLERERTRIARDLHDEMGARLCRISFLSEHARQSKSTPDELHQQIVSISDASREVLRSLDEIVWAVNPQNDTLEHVVSYIGEYAHDYFQMTGIECELDIPAQLPSHPISAQARHHLFLALHEAFTNTLKHSGATHSKVSASCGASVFEISMSDNGTGFDASSTRLEGMESGNGLRNMRRRLAEIGGSCEVQSAPGKGTSIRFVFPLNGSMKQATL